MSSDETPLNQRSVWGVSPQAVENLLATHGRETQALRTRVAELETRTSVLTAQREEAVRRVSGENTAAQNRVLELETRLSTALSQMRASEEELSLLRESADRINVLREEAVQVVADAWAMAQAIEERTRGLMERTREELHAEAAKVRAQMDDEKSRHRAEMERLGKQRVQMLMQLEATARGLLDHATLIKGSEATAEVASGLNAALRSLSAEAAATATAAAAASRDIGAPRPAVGAASGHAISPPSSRATEPSDPVRPTAPVAANGNGNGNGTDAMPPEGATTLNNALNELEALLSLPRDRWQGRTKSRGGASGANGTAAEGEGTGGNRPAADELLHRLRET